MPTGCTGAAPPYTRPPGLERFSNLPDEERLAELETLRDYLTEAVEAVDRAAASLAAPQERLKKLLEARDKKAMLLEMAGARLWVGVDVGVGVGDGLLWYWRKG